MHLKRKDSIKLKNIRKWMEGKIPVLHELSIHSGLLPKFDGARNDSLTKLLHPFRFIAISDGLTTNFSNLYDFSFNPMEVSCRNGQKGSIHIET